MKLGRTALYRHWDNEGGLLYVGISLSAVARLAQHCSSSHWSAAIAKVTIEQFDSRAEAIEAERKAIQSEYPQHNIQMRLSADTEMEKPMRLHWVEALNRAQADAGFEPLYSISSGSAKIGVSEPFLMAMLTAAGLDTVRLPECRDEMVTGWQLMAAMA